LKTHGGSESALQARVIDPRYVFLKNSVIVPIAACDDRFTDLVARPGEETRSPWSPPEADGIELIC
jgi:hypothetical protein